MADKQDQWIFDLLQQAIRNSGANNTQDRVGVLAKVAAVALGGIATTMDLEEFLAFSSRVTMIASEHAKKPSDGRVH